MAAVIGAVASGFLSWGVLSRGFELDWSFRPLFLAELGRSLTAGELTG